MSRGAGQQEIERELRRRAIGGASTLEMLTWLRDDLEVRINDPADRDGAIAFCMISTFTSVFDLGLTPGRFIASWGTERGASALWLRRVLGLRAEAPRGSTNRPRPGQVLVASARGAGLP
ncbi:hypothetical protein ACFUJY_23285 [Streptomyces sp. NPDC057249]|uniref:hypothetical protein n=1 Tax=Streptomyces sp. NPDC057249 TaxID=3346067 RepID=UPI0036443F5F